MTKKPVELVHAGAWKCVDCGLEQRRRFSDMRRRSPPKCLGCGSLFLDKVMVAPETPKKRIRAMSNRERHYDDDE